MSNETTAQGEPFAALVTKLERDLLSSEQQFLTFPTTRWPIIYPPDDAVDGSVAKQQLLIREELAIIFNQIPQVAVKFSADFTQLVWSIYEQAIRTAILPPASGSEPSGPTMQFVDYRRRLEQAQKLGIESGGTFFQTATTPDIGRIAEAGWTPLELGKDDFLQLGNAVRDDILAWLREEQLVDAPLGAAIEIKALSADILKLHISRPWLAQSIFSSRSWRHDTLQLSDGGKSPQGVLPAYITSVVLARNLTLHLDVGQPSHLRRIAAAPRLLPVDLNLKPTLRSLDLAAPKARSLLNARIQHSVHDRLLSSNPTTSALHAESEPEKLIAGDATFSFPVPIVFEARDDLIIGSPALADKLQQIERLEVVTREKEQKIVQLNAEVKRLSKQQPTTPKLNSIKPGGKLIEHRLDAMLPALKQKPLKPSVPTGTSTKLRNLLRQLSKEKKLLAEQNATLLVEKKLLTTLLKDARAREQQTRAMAQEAHILAFVCERVPRCPNPDMSLFTTP